MTKFGDYLNEVSSGAISHREHMKNVHRANAHIEHPIGYRLAMKGLIGHECTDGYWKATGEPAPVPQMLVGRLKRVTVFQMEEVGEVFEPKATNYANRAPWLYRHLHRSLVETHEHYIEYAPGVSVRLNDTEIDKLRPQPLGTAPHYDSDLKPTPKLLELFNAICRR